MKTSVLFISIAVLLFAINFNFPLIKEKKHHYITTFTGVPIEKAKSNENQGVLSTPSLHKNTPKTSKTVLNTKENYILPIDEQILVIGKNSEESEEVVSANEVAFNILDELSIQRQAYLEYDLFGLEDFTSVSRSINDGVSMGGKIIKLRYEWSHQVEKISISELKKGINIIRFHILKQANYHYKIKNARIRFAEKINNERKIIVNLPTDISHYGEYFYINGYVQTNDETPYTLYANNTPLYVFNHHFDDVLALPNNDDATIELKAVFDDGFVCSTNVNFNKNKQYHYLFNDKWIVPIYKIIWEPLNENKLNFKGLSLFSEENTVKEKMNITVMGLRNEDMPLLDANMVNVTAQYTGYRCLPHGTLFDKPIEFHLAYDSMLIPKGYGPDDVRTFFYNEQTKRWEMLELVNIDKENQQVISKTNHFTDFINAILKTPELPQTMAYTPTSIKEMKVSDPVAHVNMMAPPTANSSGTANISYPIDVPAGRQGLQPNLNVVYNSENNTGIPGNGWDIPIPKITVDTRWGVPRYDNAKETEEYLLNGEQLVELSIANGDTERLPLVHMAPYRNRTTSGQTFYSYRVEGAFQRIIRYGTNPSNYWWQVVDKNGTIYYYGMYSGDSGVNPNCILRNPNTGNIAEWALAEVRDLYGNYIKYEYGVATDSTTYSADSARIIYHRKITYTGHSSTPGAYSVEFIAPDSYAPASGQFSMRYGFRQAERAPIQQIVVKYNNDFIKGYYFKYKTGAYGKQLLCSIVEYTDTTAPAIISTKNCNELETDYIHGAKAHVFQYFEEEGLSFESNAVSILSSTEEQETIFDAFTDPTKQSIGRSKSFNIGGNSSFCVGVGVDCFTKSKSVGVNVSYSYGPTIEKVQLLDINGDGLLDKVVKDHNVYKVFKGQIDAQNHLVFSSNLYNVSGLNNLSRSYSTTKGLGVEAQWAPVYASASSSWTKQVTDRYFADINADGFPDFIDKDEILFNYGGEFSSLQDSVLPFIDDSCYSTQLGGNIDSSFFEVDNEGMGNFIPRSDPVKIWISPIPTTRISIINYIKRKTISSKNTAVNYYIQHNDSIILSGTINPNDTSLHLDTVKALSVYKGDVILFRLHSANPIGKDEINWDQTIIDNTAYEYYRYNDPDEKTNYKFQYSQDAVIHDKQVFIAPYKGQIYLTGQISSPAQSDSLQFIVKHNQTLLIDTIYPDNTAFSRSFNYDLAVNEGDTILFKLLSVSNVNWSDINFNSRVLYYQADSLPNLTAADSLSFYPTLHMSIFPKIDLCSFPHYSSGSYTIFPILYFSTNTVNDTITYTIKSKRNLIAKKQIIVQNSVIQGTNLQNSVTFSLSQPDTLYADFFSQNSQAGMYIDSAFVALLSNPNRKIKAGFYSNFPDTMQKFGNLYRHWGQFSYFDTTNQSLVDLSKLNITNTFPDTSLIANLQNNNFDSTSTFNDVYGAISGAGAGYMQNMVFKPMFANRKDKMWDDYIKSARIAVDNMISQDGYIASFNNSPYNTFEEEIPDPEINEPPIHTNSSFAYQTVKKISLQNNKSFSFSLAGVVTPTFSWTNSKTITDFIDMNGDRYPDIVSKNKIQYTTPQGNLFSGYTPLSNFNIFLNKGKANGNTFGIKELMLKNTKSGNFGTLKDLCQQGASLSFGTNVGSSETDFMLLDINGDGLPDMVNFDSAKVSYNLGYNFSNPVNINVPTIPYSVSNANSLTVPLSSLFNIKQYSWSLGFSATNNIARDKISIIDINNDGLPDLCFLGGNSIKAYLNNGTNYETTPVTLSNITNINLSKTISTNVGTSISGTIVILIFGFKISVSPGVDVSYNLNYSQERLMDLNGDNTLDYVYVDNNVIKVRYGIPKKVNLLKKIITPLKSSYTIDYAMYYPSAQNPSSKWVMTSLKIYDGFANDGIDTTYYTFNYQNPYYHRMEREFFGFETVTTTQKYFYGNSYRTTVEKYYNNHYLFKGIKKYELIQDGNGNKYVETVYTYDYKDISTGNILTPQQISCFCQAYPAISQEDKYYFEGESNYAIHTQKTYRHGPYGNIKQYVNLGNTDYPDDDLRAEISYDYNLTHNLTAMVSEIEVRDYQNNLLQYKKGYYNSLGKLVKIAQMLDANNFAETDITYDTIGNIVKIEYPQDDYGLRNQYSYVYDSIAYTYPARVTDFWGNYSTTQYDLRWGLPLEQTDITGNKIQYGYYDDGKLKYVIGPYEINTGHKTIECQYWDETPNNNYFWARTLHFDPLDTNNRFITTQFADGLKRPIQTKKKATIDGSDYMVVSGRLFFDHLGRVNINYLPIKEPLGQDSIFNFDEADYYTETQFDILDRIVQQTLPDQTIYKFAYKCMQDFWGKTCFAKITIDPNNNTITECTDAMGRKTTVYAPLDATTAFEYDPLGQLRMTRDPEDNYTYYQYDMLGRLTQRQHPDAGNTRFTYDLAGNILTKKTQKLIDNNQEIKYIYNDNRLVKIVYPENPEMNVYYEYGAPSSGNQTGRLVKQQDVSGVQTFTYGKLGELIQNTHTFVIPHGGDALTFSTWWDYDTWGRTLSITYPDGEVVNYGYDPSGNLDNVHSTKGNDNYHFIRHIYYDLFGKRSRIYYENGVKTTYKYDPANQRLTNLISEINGTVFQNIIYQYDAVGNILEILNNSDYLDKLGGNYQYTYEYDPLYRLAFSAGDFNSYHHGMLGFKLNMQYTASGNISSKELSASKLVDDDVYNIGYSNNYQYNDRPHNVTSDGNNYYEWDANGNLVHKQMEYGYRNLCWDEENRLTAVRNQAEETQLSAYLYDADGKRTWKFSGTTNLLQINGQTVLQQTALNKTLYVNPYMIITESNYTKHYFMESERVATKNGSGFSTATIKPWDSTLTFIIGDADSLGSILDNIINRQAQCTGDTGTVTVVSRHFEPVNNNNEFEKTYFYHPDHLGSASFITHMDGHPMQHLQYLPYGELFVSQSFKDYGFDSRYKFAAKERDEETGYDYFGARYYDNEGPIWLSVDPMSDSRPNLSPYNYCQWNPVGRIDPDGAFDGWVEDPDNPNAGVYWDPKINSESEAIVAGKTYRGQTVLANDAKGSFRFGDETGQWHDVVILDEITVNAKRYDQNNGIGLWGNARQEVFDWGRAKQQENPMTISDFQLYDPVKDVLNFIAGKFINWWLAPSSTPNSSGNRAKNINKKSDSIVEISTKKYIETIKPNGEIIKEINPQYNKVIGKHKRISNDETDTIYLKYLK